MTPISTNLMKENANRKSLNVANLALRFENLSKDRQHGVGFSNESATLPELAPTESQEQEVNSPSRITHGTGVVAEGMGRADAPTRSQTLGSPIRREASDGNPVSESKSSLRLRFSRPAATDASSQIQMGSTTAGERQCKWSKTEGLTTSPKEYEWMTTSTRSPTSVSSVEASTSDLSSPQYHASSVRHKDIRNFRALSRTELPEISSLSQSQAISPRDVPNNPARALVNNLEDFLSEKMSSLRCTTTYACKQSLKNLERSTGSTTCTEKDNGRRLGGSTIDLSMLETHSENDRARTSRGEKPKSLRIGTSQENSNEIDSLENGSRSEILSPLRNPSRRTFSIKEYPGGVPLHAAGTYDAIDYVESYPSHLNDTQPGETLLDESAFRRGEKELLKTISRLRTLTTESTKPSRSQQDSMFFIQEQIKREVTEQAKLHARILDKREAYWSQEKRKMVFRVQQAEENVKRLRRQAEKQEGELEAQARDLQDLYARMSVERQKKENANQMLSQLGEEKQGLIQTLESTRVARLEAQKFAKEAESNLWTLRREVEGRLVELKKRHELAITKLRSKNKERNEFKTVLDKDLQVQLSDNDFKDPAKLLGKIKKTIAAKICERQEVFIQRRVREAFNAQKHAIVEKIEAELRRNMSGLAQLTGFRSFKSEELEALREKAIQEIRQKIVHEFQEHIESPDIVNDIVTGIDEETSTRNVDTKRSDAADPQCFNVGTTCHQSTMDHGSNTDDLSGSAHGKRPTSNDHQAIHRPLSIADVMQAADDDINEIKDIVAHQLKFMQTENEALVTQIDHDLKRTGSNLSQSADQQDGVDKRSWMVRSWQGEPFGLRKSRKEVQRVVMQAAFPPPKGESGSLTPRLENLRVNQKFVVKHIQENKTRCVSSRRHFSKVLCGAGSKKELLAICPPARRSVHPLANRLHHSSRVVVPRTLHPNKRPRTLTRQAAGSLLSIHNQDDEDAGHATDEPDLGPTIKVSIVNNPMCAQKQQIWKKFHRRQLTSDETTVKPPTEKSPKPDHLERPRGGIPTKVPIHEHFNKGPSGMGPSGKSASGKSPPGKGPPGKNPPGKDPPARGPPGKALLGKSPGKGPHGKLGSKTRNATNLPPIYFAPAPKTGYTTRGLAWQVLGAPKLQGTIWESLLVDEANLPSACHVFNDELQYMCKLKAVGKLFRETGEDSLVLQSIRRRHSEGNLIEERVPWEVPYQVPYVLSRFEVCYETCLKLFFEDAQTVLDRQNRKRYQKSNKKLVPAGVLDRKRLQNIQISLKALGLHDSVQSLVNCVQNLHLGLPEAPTPPNEEPFKDGTIDIILSLWPTPEEESILKNPEEPLLPAEKVLLELINVKRFKERAQCIVCRLNFESQGKSLSEKVEKLDSVMKAAISSLETGLIRGLLGMLLRIGNFLNYGTNKGEARGVQLSSIDSMRKLMSVDGSSSLLRYVAHEVDKQFPSCWQEMEWVHRLPEVGNVNPFEMEKVFKDLDRQIKLVGIEIRDNSEYYEDKFLEIFTPFVQRAVRETSGWIRQCQQLTEDLIGLNKMFATNGKTPQEGMEVLKKIAALCLDAEAARDVNRQITLDEIKSRKRAARRARTVQCLSHQDEESEGQTPHTDRPMIRPSDTVDKTPLSGLEG